MAPCFSGELPFMIRLNTISVCREATFITSGLTSSGAPLSMTERWPNGRSTFAIHSTFSAVFAVESTRSM